MYNKLKDSALVITCIKNIEKIESAKDFRS